jgi:hypothetical protein
VYLYTRGRGVNQNGWSAAYGGDGACGNRGASSSLTSGLTAPPAIRVVTASTVGRTQ